jgi:hypothetical protein
MLAIEVNDFALRVLNCGPIGDAQRQPVDRGFIKYEAMPYQPTTPVWARSWAIFDADQGATSNTNEVPDGLRGVRFS